MKQGSHTEGKLDFIFVLMKDHPHIRFPFVSVVGSGEYV